MSAVAGRPALAGRQMGAGDDDRIDTRGANQAATLGKAAVSTPRPRVDVGVVTFNTAELTTTALRRLLDTDQGCDLRVMVHDNASGDGTPQVLAEVVPEADVEVGDENLGFARAVNRMLARSDAPWFMALNSDAWPEPGAVAQLVRAGEQHPEAAAIAPKLLRPDGSLEHSTHGFPSLAVAGADALGVRGRLPRRWASRRCLAGHWSHDQARAVDWAVGAALLLRRRAVEEIGGFDERFFMYVEDLAWCWSARQAGWTVWFEPAATVRHVGNASGAAHFGGRREALEVANRQMFLASTWGRWRAEAFRGLELLSSARAAMAAAYRGDDQAVAHWRHQAKCLLGLVPVPAPGVHLAPRITPEQPQVRASTTRWHAEERVRAPSDPPRAPDDHPLAPDDHRVMLGDSPLVSVVIPTCDRADHLRRLLRALAEQTLWHEEHRALHGGAGPGSSSAAGGPVPIGASAQEATLTVTDRAPGGQTPSGAPGRPSVGEVIVVDDASTDDTVAVAAEVARWFPVPVHVLRQPARRGPAAARNRGWRQARAPVVAFTDDDCVPSPRWLAAGLAAMDGGPMAVVGRTEAPEDQLREATTPFARVLEVHDSRFAETCNVFYRRSDLDAIGGFDERFRRPSGEDTRLALDLRVAGLEHRYEADALVHHDVRTGGWRGAWSETGRWVDLPLVLAGRPWARRELAHHMVFWKPTHPPALGLVAGLLLARRRPVALVLCGPWLWRRTLLDPACGSWLGRVRCLPGAAAIDLLEVAVMVRGSWRHRTLVL